MNNELSAIVSAKQEGYLSPDCCEKMAGAGRRKKRGCCAKPDDAQTSPRTSRLHCSSRNSYVELASGRPNVIRAPLSD